MRSPLATRPSRPIPNVRSSGGRPLTWSVRTMTSAPFECADATDLTPACSAMSWNRRRGRAVSEWPTPLQRRKRGPWREMAEQDRTGSESTSSSPSISYPIALPDRRGPANLPGRRARRLAARRARSDHRDDAGWTPTSERSGGRRLGPRAEHCQRSHSSHPTRDRGIQGGKPRADEKSPPNAVSTTHDYVTREWPIPSRTASRKLGFCVAKCAGCELSRWWRTVTPGRS